jgi:hypothetical protein
METDEGEARHLKMPKKVGVELYFSDFRHTNIRLFPAPPPSYCPPEISTDSAKPAVFGYKQGFRAESVFLDFST